MKNLSVLLIAVAAVSIMAFVPVRQGKATTPGAPSPVKLKLSSIYAYAGSGTRNPAKDKECHELYKGFLDSVMTTEYSTQTAKSWAKSTWVVKGYSDVVFELNPLGVAGTYSYGSWYRKEFNGKEVYGVTFSARAVNMQPVAPYKSTISFIVDDNLTCALMNSGVLKSLMMKEPADAMGNK